jgi:Kef-type K+ transport system membrane component KefB
MKAFKNGFFYILVIGGFSALMYWIIQHGSSLEIGRSIVNPSGLKSQWQEFVDAMMHNIKHPLAMLLAQILTIILVARIFGWISVRIGQPSVIGEILAGIFLGPSVVGYFFPGFSSALFPSESLPNLQFLSQIGLILFMFVIGMELDLKVLKTKAHDAVVISHASIIFPFAMGMGLAYFIYKQFAPEGVQFISFGLFLGIAMSITAFPVLARIVQERGLHRTKLGTVIITCAAADDITAWCILAAVIAIVKAGSMISALYVIAMAVIYVIAMIFLVRPFLKRVGELHNSVEKLSKPIVAIFFLTLIISSYATEVIGIHALFGAFMAGAIMPENTKFRNIFIEKVEDVSLVLLLPLFFVFTGLRTQVGLLDDVNMWVISGIIFMVAVTGKFVGSSISALYVGQSLKDSLTIGALMNTRGLMELVVLNIGYDLGVLTPEIFAMMVLMALATTFMTGPSLDLINWIFKSKDEIVPKEIHDTRKFKILISFGNPQRGKTLLRLANGFIKKNKENASITAMHLTPSNELHRYNASEYERNSFSPIIEESKNLDQKIFTLFKASTDVNADIAEVANLGDFDLLIVGVGQSMFEGSLLGKILGFTTRMISPDRIINQVTGKENLFENSLFDDRTRLILSKSKVPVGIFLDKGLNSLERIIIPFLTGKDAILLTYLQKLIQNSGAQITVVDVNGEIKNYPDFKEKIRSIEMTAPNHIQIVNSRDLDQAFLLNFDLVLISLDSWRSLIENKQAWLSSVPSCLIVTEN